MLLFKTSLIKFAAIIIALQVLNMSIGLPNAMQYDSYKPTDNFNYINTYVEYFSKVIFDHQNTIPQGKRHQKHWQQHKLQQVICDNFRSSYREVTSSQPLRNIFFNYCNIYFYQFIKEISPPPKFSC